MRHLNCSPVLGPLVARYRGHSFKDIICPTLFCHSLVCRKSRSSIYISEQYVLHQNLDCRNRSRPSNSLCVLKSGVGLNDLILEVKLF